MKYDQYILKRKLEDLLMSPLIGIGRLIGLFTPYRTQYRSISFFSFYHIGGAEKVHAQIALATGGPDSLIYFTRKPANDLFLGSFKASESQIRDIARFTDNKWLYPVNIIMRGVISGRINTLRNRPVVFNGQNNFGYKISPWLNRNIRQVELIHSFNTFSWIRLPFLAFIRQTVMIARQRIEDHLAQYRQIGVPASFENRISYIGNAIPVPLTPPVRTGASFTVLYAGRGGIEKRLPLIGKIFSEIHSKNKDIRFVAMGDVSDVLDQHQYPYVEFLGNLSNEEKIQGVYRRSDVLLLTSTTEGFPMVVIEAMAHGCAIVSTPVGDIPRHIRNDASGLVLDTVDDEDRITTTAAQWIIRLAGDSELRKRIVLFNFVYAREHFDIGQFNAAWKQAFYPSDNDHP